MRALPIQACCKYRDFKLYVTVEVHLIYKGASRITFVTYLIIQLTCKLKITSHLSLSLFLSVPVVTSPLSSPPLFTFLLPVSVCSFPISWLPCLFACRGFPLVIYLQVLSMGRWRSLLRTTDSSEPLVLSFLIPCSFKRKPQGSLLQVYFCKIVFRCLKCSAVLIFFFNLKSVSLYSTPYNSSASPF